jgi:hypothetical protein
MFALCTALSSCASPQGATEPTSKSDTTSLSRPPDAGLYHVYNEKETYRVSFKPKPNPIPLVEAFEIDVQVRRHPSGEPVGPVVSLKVDAAMPEHRHGMTTQPRVTRGEGGWFHVDGMMFHMPGHWEIYFDVIEGAVSERATFEIEME